MTLTQEPVRTRSRGTWARLADRTAAGIALGVAGLFMFNIICGPFAIGLGIASYRQAARRNSRAGRVAALVSILLGVADLVLLAVLTASRLRGGGLSWHVGAVS